jgi:hypothetical protein
MLMKIKTHQAHIALAITIALLGIVVPYIVAWRISPAGTVFTGFLINPIDGFSYLAKMRQGFEGAWLFELPYTAEPGAGTFLFVFYIVLGHLSRVLNAPLIITYHVVRVIVSAGFFTTLYIFFDQIFEDRRLTWAGFLLSLFGSGLGWLALIAGGRQSIDLWVPEAIPFLSAYANPHFPLAASAFILGILLTIRQGERSWAQWLLAAILGTVIGAVLPFVVIPLFLVLGAWIIWEYFSQPKTSLSAWFSRAPLTLLLLVLGALPWLVYDFWISISHPVIAEWNNQNLTPSPPLVDTVMGYGPVLVFALVSLYSRPWRCGREGRLLTTWLLLGLILLYVPLPFQRRLSMGLYLPMAGLTVWWLDRLAVIKRRFQLAYVLLICLTLPSILIVMIAGLSGVENRSEAILFNQSELEAYDWIREQVPNGAVLLTDPLHGNRLPAFAPVKVFYGHPFETPRADFWLDEVNSLLHWEANAVDGLQLLNEYGVDWVLLDRPENSENLPIWQAELPVRFSKDSLYILENTTR